MLVGGCANELMLRRILRYRGIPFFGENDFLNDGAP